MVFGCQEEWDFLVWPHLNKVVSKKTDITKWHRDIHVLQLWIHAKNKKAAKGLAREKRRRNKRPGEGCQCGSPQLRGLRDAVK